MAGETFIHISQDEREFARLTSELKYVLDNQSMLVDARRAGLAEGISMGRKDTMEMIIQNALAQGIPIETISGITGLDQENIKNPDK